MGLSKSTLAAILAQRVGSGFALLTSTQAAGATNPVSTSGIDTTGARLIVVSASTNVVGSAGMLTDSRGNTWVSLGSTITPGSTYLWRWYCINPSVGSGHTFSVANVFTSVRVQAFSGPATVSYQAQSDATATGTSIAPGSVTPSNSGALVVSGVFYSSTNNSFGVTGGLTITSNQSFASGVNWGGSMAYLVQTTAAAINPTWTLDPSQGSAAFVAVFLP